MKNVSKIFVTLENGTKANLKAIYSPSGKLLGKVFDTISFNLEGDLAVNAVLDKLNVINEMYLGKQLIDTDINKVKLAYLEGAFCDISEVGELGILMGNYLNGSAICDFFEIESYFFNVYDVEFVLAFNVEYDENNNAMSINYYLTFIDASTAERMLMRERIVENEKRLVEESSYATLSTNAFMTKLGFDNSVTEPIRTVLESFNSAFGE